MTNSLLEVTSIVELTQRQLRIFYNIVTRHRQSLELFAGSAQGASH